MACAPGERSNCKWFSARQPSQAMDSMGNPIQRAPSPKRKRKRTRTRTRTRTRARTRCNASSPSLR